MISTPNAPDGLFERIEKEPEETCIYKRLFLDYTYGIGKIYTAEEIEKGRKYNPDIIGSSYFTSKSMGIDPAYGSSAFGIVVTQWLDNHIQILHAEEYHRPDYNEMPVLDEY
jgi:hypothetical protein